MAILNHLRLLLSAGFIIMVTGCDKDQAIYPQRKDLVETVYASGKIVAADEFRLAALSSGTVIKKLVRDGDSVQAGQLLYVVDNESAKTHYEAALKNYQAINSNLSDNSPLLNDLKLTLQNATLQCSNDSIIYYRYKILWAQQIGTENNLESVRTKYEISLNQKKIAEQKYHATLRDLQVSHSNARSQLSAAGNELKEYFIRSDRNGVVYQTFKETGETVFINEVVALIGATKDKHTVRMAVDQQDINKIRIGQQVLIQTDATGSKVYEAVVTYIYTVMNEQDQTFRVDATFTGETPPSFIHGSIEANIIVQQKNHTLVLPRTVLTGTDSIWIRINGKKEKRAIQTGISTLEYVEILSGIDEETPVLLINKNK